MAEKDLNIGRTARQISGDNYQDYLYLDKKFNKMCIIEKKEKEPDKVIYSNGSISYVGMDIPDADFYSRLIAINHLNPRKESRLEKAAQGQPLKVSEFFKAMH